MLVPVIVAAGYIKSWTDFITCAKGILKRLRRTVEKGAWNRKMSPCMLCYYIVICLAFAIG
jgi:hypothetical protein